jgi:gamma-glutamyltranspeptidase/glutathione hydrolase
MVLARGGSAIDAAITVNAALGVVEPERGGIGGDLFVIYWESKTGKLTGINASGWAVLRCFGGAFASVKSPAVGPPRLPFPGMKPPSALP